MSTVSLKGRMTALAQTSGAWLTSIKPSASFHPATPTHASVRTQKIAHQAPTHVVRIQLCGCHILLYCVIFIIVVTSQPILQNNKLDIMLTYTPLADPARQIRLLSFDTQPLEYLSLRMKTYDMADCPSYTAASYCCGDSTYREPVTVNGADTTVNKNCWHVLRQIHAQAQGGHYWVDSLCINQRDRKEKAVQVYKIAAIFASAAEVWACFGPHAADSDFLIRTLKDFPPQDKSHPVAKSLHERSDDTQRRTLNYLVSLGDHLKRFAVALKAFGRRPFFSRMWIYQEMFLATKVVIVCGDETADMQALKEIELICSTLIMSYRPQSDYDYKDAQLKLLPMLKEADLFMKLHDDEDLGALSILVSQLHRKTPDWTPVPFGTDIVSIQSRISKLQCEDARDKIFAIINMFGESCSILPDYDISAFDLALQVLNEYGIHENDHNCVELAAYLCTNLRLYSTTTEVAESLARNLAIDYSDNPRSPHQTAVPSVLRRSTALASQVSRTTAGQMTAPFTANPLSNPVSSSDRNFLVVNQRPVAVATCEFAVGDWVAPLSHYVSQYYHNYCLGLVLRSKGANVYDVVGEVAFFPKCKPCTSWETCNCQFGPQFHTDFHTTFDVTFDAEELLLFAARLREPFESMRREMYLCERGQPELPAGPPMKWLSTYAERRDSTSPIRSPFQPRDSVTDREPANTQIKLRMS